MMNLNKLRPELAEQLDKLGISELNDFQLRIIDAVKSGKNVLAEGPTGSGKTTAILLSVLQKITEPGEGSPRALIVCPDDDRARELHRRFSLISRYLDLTVDLAHEKGNMLQQRNDIFDGTEIIVGTPKRMHALYIQNGFNVSKLRLFILDDAIDVFKGGFNTQVSRIVESLPKCQHLLFSHSFTERRIEEYLDENVPLHITIEAE